MKIRLAVALIVLFFSLSAVAQTAYTPPTLPPLFSTTDLANSASLMTNVNANVKIYTDLLLLHDAKLAQLSDQAAAVSALQAQVATAQSKILALEARVAALESKVQTAGTTLATP